jgi:antitoxin component YwqK of YwqJK toxin-antitoxin module
LMQPRMFGSLKNYHGDQVYELIWLLKQALPCQLAVEGILQEAIDVDVTRKWHANGEMKDESAYNKGGQRHGLGRVWHTNGKRKMEGVWKNGNKNGVHRVWDKDGKIRIEEGWKNGQEDGVHRVWGADGQLRIDEEWKDGVIQIPGSLKRYHGDQFYELIWLFKQVVPCQLAVAGILQEAVDVRREWRANGNLRCEVGWKDGQPHGIDRGWYENGQLWYECEWKDGQPHGVQREWYADGQLRYEQKWVKGREVN